MSQSKMVDFVSSAERLCLPKSRRARSSGTSAAGEDECLPCEGGEAPEASVPRCPDGRKCRTCTFTDDQVDPGQPQPLGEAPRLVPWDSNPRLGLPNHCLILYIMHGPWSILYIMRASSRP